MKYVLLTIGTSLLLAGGISFHLDNNNILALFIFFIGIFCFYAGFAE